MANLYMIYSYLCRQGFEAEAVASMSGEFVLLFAPPQERAGEFLAK